MWEFRGSVMCFENGRLLGNEEDLTFWAEKQWSFTSSHPQELCVALSQDYFSKQLQSTGASPNFLNYVPFQPMLWKAM